jgi:lysophospholipase L1-like esterase
MILFAALLGAAALSAQGDHDWANFGKYAETNAGMKAKNIRPDAVFMGNSITEGWAGQHPDFFTKGNYTGRGISGQVTAQMLARFRPDVLDLAPKAVVILAGTNDIAQNEGFISVENIAGNIISMAELAKTHKIKVVICSVLPASHYPWHPHITDVAAKVKRLNALLSDWAAKNKCTYVDYWTPMADDQGGLPKSLAGDGIHPNDEGFRQMEAILAPTLNKLLKKK